MHVLACLLSLAGSDVPPELLLKQRNQALEAEGVLRTMMRLHYVRLTHTHTHSRLQRGEEVEGLKGLGDLHLLCLAQPRLSAFFQLPPALSVCGC